ncbi:MAG: trigger factor, partial [Clostridia bacterium]|nr:trigger factor [Clostridia bacterium]
YYMNYTVENLEKNKAKITVKVDAQDWQNALQKAYEKTKSKYQIGGFRKGHVPYKVLVNAYGIGIFFDDALDIILPQEYGKVLEQEKDLEPVDSPEVGINAISDTTLEFTLTVQCKPDFTLGKYTGLEIARDKVEVSEEEVQAEINAKLEEAGAWVPVVDRPAQNGDQVLIDYSGSVDGVKFDGGTAEKQTLTLGSGMFIPGFEEQVVGMNIGDEKDVNVTFPEEYHEKSLAGKQAVFAVKLHEINIKDVLTLDDESVKDISEFDTVAEYKASVKSKIEEKKNAEADSKLENDLIQKIADDSKVEIPQCMVEQQIDDMIQEFEQRLQYQGLNAKDYYKYTGMTQEKLRENYKEMAEKNVKLRLTLEALLKAIQVPVSEEEIDEKIADMAKQAGKTFEEYKGYINDQYREYLRRDLVTSKLFEYLKNNNT